MDQEPVAEASSTFHVPGNGFGELIAVGHAVEEMRHVGLGKGWIACPGRDENHVGLGDHLLYEVGVPPLAGPDKGPCFLIEDQFDSLFRSLAPRTFHGSDEELQFSTLEPSLLIDLAHGQLCSLSGLRISLVLDEETNANGFAF